MRFYLSYLFLVVEQWVLVYLSRPASLNIHMEKIMMDYSLQTAVRGQKNGIAPIFNNINKRRYQMLCILGPFGPLFFAFFACSRFFACAACFGFSGATFFGFTWPVGYFKSTYFSATSSTFPALHWFTIFCGH